MSGYVTHRLEVCAIILCLQHSNRARVYRLDTLLLPDVCKYKTRIFGLKSWDTEDTIEVIRAVQYETRKWAVLQLSRIATFVVLYSVIAYTQTPTLLKQSIE
jgi:hypothetical protein